MESLQSLLAQLGDEIEDPEEETFLLFSQRMSSHDLGFIDPKVDSLNVVVAGKDYVIHQSPGMLSSSRAGGTTGAVVLWKVTPLFAEWFSSSDNLLFGGGILGHSSAVLELGCGISPLNALALSSQVARYVLTDQSYVSRFVQQNLEENLSSGPRSRSLGRAKKGSRTTTTTRTATQSGRPRADISFQVLDWETDQVTPSLAGTPDVRSFDTVIACDCVFNYALVRPFVQTCADICRLGLSDPKAERPCLAIVAQQLRNDDVFRSWLTEFMSHFHVWRLPDERLPEPLRPTAGFVVHLGVLKEYC